MGTNGSRNSRRTCGGNAGGGEAGANDDLSGASRPAEEKKDPEEAQGLQKAKARETRIQKARKAPHSQEALQAPCNQEETRSEAPVHEEAQLRCQAQEVIWNRSLERRRRTTGLTDIIKCDY